MDKLQVLVVLSVFGLVVGDFPFRNISLSWEDRVNDLVSRLNLTEVMLQMAKGGAGEKGGPAPAIPRLLIEPYQWNEECLRGAAGAGEATAFPQAIGLAAAFSPSLIQKVAEATGIEVRAKHNDYVKKGQYGDHKGLSCFSPVINIMRHPLWGRNQETYGEDPFLSGVYAAHYVRGLQGNDPRYIRANAGCKHFDAYAGPENYPESRLSFNAEETYGEDPYLSGVYASHFVKGLQGDHYRYVRANAGCKHFNVHGGPENIPTSRFSFNAKVAERDWRLTFLPAFRECVRAGTYSLMCSYNSLNGIPACANHELLTKVLRGQWGFKGYVISDEVALEFIITQHKYINNTLDTAVACVKAGCNIELSGNNPAVYLRIEDAVKQGKLSEILVRERVKPLFYTRMRLGEFDPAEMNPYLLYNLSLVQSQEHRDLAIQAAMKTFVLLKNANNLLPVQNKLEKISIVGPMADNVQQLYGDYAADVDSKYVETPLKGLAPMSKAVGYGAGCTDNKCTHYNPEEIKAALTATNLTIICVGTGQELEAEGNDRHSMDLPANQLQLIHDTIIYNNGKSPIILLIFSAGPVTIPADVESKVGAIMQCFFPAQATGQALLNTLTMRTMSPAGRLPYTWYKSDSQVPSITDYSMAGKTYRYFKGTPLYPFGYGLSYSQFQYSHLTLIKDIQAGDDQEIIFDVTNIGPVEADEVVQVYMSWLSTGQRMPQRQLVAFDRFHLKANATESVTFVISSEQMAVWTTYGWVVQTGTMQISVGGQQPDQEISVGSNILTEKFSITGGDAFLGIY